MRRVCLLVTLGSGFIAAACARAPATASSGSADSVAVDVDRSRYSIGDTVATTVSNGTGGEIVFAFVCDAAIEGRTDAAWVLVFEPDCANVRVRPTRLAAGQAAAFLLPLRLMGDAELSTHQAFRLRFRYQRNDDSGYRIVHSTAFEVRAD